MLSKKIMLIVTALRLTVYPVTKVFASYLTTGWPWKKQEEKTYFLNFIVDDVIFRVGKKLPRHCVSFSSTNAWADLGKAEQEAEPSCGEIPQLCSGGTGQLLPPVLWWWEP